ncbi:PREDICTED: guanylate kinase-like isoform X1 [Acropora digitifera]|uniref:guanylate kinase-like isoform X1 n=1 Tax=Acropora digitifera TaxID=70779 RepID=UPI00077AE728|nr:PREDICTED: guanylate kinase-like isoform X1 [Acropora digitifera]
MVSKAKPLVLCGPSGCGKSTLTNRLLKDHPSKFGFSISHTTRGPRPGEVNGREYYFTDRASMQKSVDAGEFIEWAIYNGNMYGTSKKAIQDVMDSGKACVLDIDMQGVKKMKNSGIDCYYIFVKTPSLEELEKRLRSRGTETEESLSKRLEIAKKELAFAETPGNFNRVIINDDLDRAYNEFHDTVSKNIICLSSS